MKESGNYGKRQDKFRTDIIICFECMSSLGSIFKTVANLISRKRLPSRDKIASSHCRLTALNASDVQKFSNISELAEFVVLNLF